MRDMIDLTNAFGKADEGFVSNVNNCLANIKLTGNSKNILSVRKTSLRLVAAIAVVCMLLTVTALALTNSWGILDFISERMHNTEVLPEAAGIIQTDIAQNGGQTDFANFEMREAVFDGQNAYIVVEVTPASPEYLLLGPDAYPSDPVGNMGPLFSDDTGTIADYARNNNKEMISTSVSVDGQNQSIDFILEDGGTLVYMIKCSIVDASAELEAKLLCAASTFIVQNGEYGLDINNNKGIAELSVTLKNSGTNGTVTSTAPVIFSDCGVRVDNVTLTASSMAIYAEIEFTVIDEERFAETDGGLWFEFLDNSNERLPEGADSSGSSENIGGNHYIQKTSLQACETLPEKIVLRGFNCWEKNRYETHSILME